jgi:hypothetical protein
MGRREQRARAVGVEVKIDDFSATTGELVLTRLVEPREAQRDTRRRIVLELARRSVVPRIREPE